MIDALSHLAQAAAMQHSIKIRPECRCTTAIRTQQTASDERFALEKAAFPNLGIQQPNGWSFRIPNPARKRAGGFTLIEILVVVVILGILAAIVVPRVMERPAEARIVRVKQDLQGVMTALSMYKLDNHRFPSSEQGLQALTIKPSGQPEAPNWKGPYLDRLPKDPWDHPYQYQQPGQHGDVDIYSYGADGRPGGEGDDADIGNWES